MDLTVGAVIAYLQDNYTPDQPVVLVESPYTPDNAVVLADVIQGVREG